MTGPWFTCSLKASALSGRAPPPWLALIRFRRHRVRAAGSRRNRRMGTIPAVVVPPDVTTRSPPGHAYFAGGPMRNAVATVHLALSLVAATAAAHADPDARCLLASGGAAVRCVKRYTA